MLCNADTIPPDTYYSPRRVRVLLAAYAELLDSRRPNTESSVRGNRPAWQVQEDLLAQRADIAHALVSLWHRNQPMGKAVALAHGLDISPDGTVIPLGDAPLLAGQAPRALSSTAILTRLDHAPHHASTVARGRNRALVADMIATGVEVLAHSLGYRWQDGDDD